MARKTFSPASQQHGSRAREGNGVGEWITVEFEGMRTVRSITVRNGYQKSNDIFRKEQPRAAFASGVLARRDPYADLQDRSGSNPDAAQAGQGLLGQVHHRRVWAGNKYTDTAITKLVVNSEPAVIRATPGASIL